MWESLDFEGVERDCSPPFSFYHDLIAKYWFSQPTRGEVDPLHWICTFARKMHATRVIVENARGLPSVVTELETLHEALGPSPIEAGAVAITFFDAAAPVDASQTPDHRLVIAQAIVVSFPLANSLQSFVLEASIRTPGERSSQDGLLNNHLPFVHELEVIVKGGTHRFEGIWFCQQNGVTSVCAHAALRMVYHAITGEKLPASRIEKILSPASSHEGVNATLLAEAISELGYRPFIYEFSHDDEAGGKQLEPSDDFNRRDASWDVACSAIQSSYPALLAVPTSTEMGHVTPVIGYTLNTDEWHPHARALYYGEPSGYLSSSDWIDHLVINDDQAGPHYCLSQAWFANGSIADSLRVAPKAVIAILPDHVEISPAVAEQIAANFLRAKRLKDLDERHPGDREARWWRHLVDKEPQLVLRTTLAIKSDYFKHLGDLAVAEGASLEEAMISAIRDELPDTFWLTEVSLPNLFVGNRSKLGEVILRTSPRPLKGRSSECVLAFRLPSLVGWGRGDTFALEPCPMHEHARIVGGKRRSEW